MTKIRLYWCKNQIVLINKLIIQMFTQVQFQFQNSTFLSGYPLFLLHRQFLRKSPPFLQHAFFALSGMAIAYWSIGSDAIIHSSTCIMVTWSTMKIFQGSLNSTLFMYLFHMGYLGAGYFFKQSSGYDINWTMPGCVLCLRLIGLFIILL